ncbi:DUF4302 domain-containing protein [Pseudochryseolinea flava]|uniref:DUF4302 domain-containing protein n=1 Tax=Pseudochryseolinea flava TaxID=2059302 RepID=A0A364Y3C9_9BACT|nr:DUF4302 domain-containing protein [Pseudochryseolinea flava]RAW00519.1 hypothetical protein DQQ10_13040 [Pseudochryseolinea flava]
MKQIKIYTIVSLVATLAMMTSCDKQYDTIFKETPDERVQAALAEYNQTLVNAPHGWTASLYTGTGAGYFYYFNFKDDGTVNMLSDFNVTTAGEIMGSTWTLKALQRPSLSFTTYSYVHLPADPDGNINNGIPGSGLRSDFEFAFVRTAGDSIIMEGLLHKAQLFLVKASAEEKTAYEGKRIQELFLKTETYLNDYRGYTLTLPNNVEVPMALALEQKLISFQYLAAQDETIQLPMSAFTFSTDGIILKDPIRIHDYTIKKLVWDDNTESYHVTFDTPVTLVGNDSPFILRPATPLHSILGEVSIKTLIPYGAGENPLPAQSDEFTEAYNFAATQMHEGEFRLTLENMQFVFPPNTDRMFFVVSVLQPVSGGGYARFLAQYTYSYQVRADGTIKFKLEGNDDNAGALYADLIGILNHFDNDTFTLEYVGGGFSKTVAFFSQEEIGYHFGAYMTE